MVLKTGREYIESLKSLRPIIYYQGARIDDVATHPLTRPHVRAAAMTYEIAREPEYKELATAVSHLSGERINRFTHIHQSKEDLISKVKLLRTIARRTGTCFQRCVGLDALNAVYSVSFRVEAQTGIPYHQRFLRFLRQVQDEDMMLAGAMTDPKGDRSKSPGQQEDPDMFLRIVEKREEGVVIRGAKMHMTGMVNSQEMLIMPTTALKKGEEEYAIACAIPIDAPGVYHIFGRQTNDQRKFGRMDQGNEAFGVVGGECLTVLEDVFVPWKRVFLCGEVEYAGQLVELFASYHRQNYGGCKSGTADVIIGAAASLAEANGVEKAGHVKDKLTEMAHLTESLYCCAIACSCEGSCLDSGAWYVDPLLANVDKQNVTRSIYEIARLSHDIAGGLIATMPTEEDMTDPELGPVIRKYLKANSRYTPEERYQLARLLENMTGGTALVESMHGAGSPQAQRVVMARQANLEEKKAWARTLAGIRREKDV